MDNKDIKLSNITRTELTDIVAEIIGELQSKPTEWKVEIKKTDNGLIATYNGGDSEETKVYQQKPEDDIYEKEQYRGGEENFEHYVAMFYDILDYFGDNPRRKYRHKYINIEYVGGDEE